MIKRGRWIRPINNREDLVLEIDGEEYVVEVKSMSIGSTNVNLGEVRAVAALSEAADEAHFHVFMADPAQTLFAFTHEKRQKVPKGFLLDAFLPSDLAEEALYAILDRHPHWVAKYGARKAAFIFVTQSLGCIIRFWVDWILKRFEILRSPRRS
jgi:hypothetical protein